MAKLEKMVGGARTNFVTALLFFVAAIAYILYKQRQVHILLLLGIFAVLFGASSDFTGALLAASVLSVGYIFFMDKRVSEGFEDKGEEKKNIPPPDHGDRAEMFQLGKKYKMPSEKDDSEFHLDAGTTFMNAYKALKPDQVAAMTKDTQELMETQKQLMSTLQTLKPLITDGKQMMEMFQSYFGTGNPTPN
jgi:hypothetical protein